MIDIEIKRMMDFYGLTPDMMNSPHAFPRLPPSRPNQNFGLSRASKLKENIIRDNASMLAKLYDFHTAFQHHAAGLFDLAPSQFGPGHPLHSKIGSINLLQAENEQLKNENAVLKRDLEKLRQKQV
ncbi:MAG: hypothetical protein ACREAG_02555 [Nitrosopumilaceae archaeon]